jgi:hypothetical protein
VDTTGGTVHRLRSLVSFTDVIVASVVAFALLMPSRPLLALDLFGRLDDRSRAQLPLVEARALAAPRDADATQELTRRLAAARQMDWAVDTALHGVEAAAAADRWRALLIAAEAYADRIDLDHAMEFAGQALAACRGGDTSCPPWEELRLDLYNRYLDAGKRSGIDPLRDPLGFREAARQGLGAVDITSFEPVDLETPPAADPAAPPAPPAPPAAAPPAPPAADPVVR